MPSSSFDALVENYFLCLIVPAMVVGIELLIYSETTGICGMLQRWGKASSQRAANISANAREGNRQLDIPPEQDVTVWGIFVAIPFHHIPASLLAFLGWYYESTGLVRLGLGMEGAENILHFAQMIWAKINPSTRWGMWSMMPGAVWFFVICHHTIGMTGTTFGHYVLADDPDFQFLVFLLLGVDMPQSFPYLLYPFGDATQPGSPTFLPNLLLKIVGWTSCLYVRFILYVPLAYSLNSKAWLASGPVAGVLTAAALLVFFTFSTLAIFMDFMALMEIVQAFIKGASTEEKKATISRATSFRGLGAVGVVVQSKNTKLRAVARMVMLEKHVEKKQAQ